MSAMNRKMFANRDARNKLAGMGGILASSPELMGATQRFQDGGMTTPRGVPDSPRLSESMNVPIATLGGKSFFLSADNRSIVDGDGSVVRDPSVLRAIMQQTAPAPAPQSEEFVPSSMGASELNTPGIMQALNNAPQIQDERSALMAEAQSLIEANRTPESDALRARVDESMNPQGIMSNARALLSPEALARIDGGTSAEFAVEPSPTYETPELSGLEEFEQSQPIGEEVTKQMRVLDMAKRGASLVDMSKALGLGLADVANIIAGSAALLVTEGAALAGDVSGLISGGGDLSKTMFEESQSLRELGRDALLPEIDVNNIDQSAGILNFAPRLINNSGTAEVGPDELAQIEMDSLRNISDRMVSGDEALFAEGAPVEQLGGNLPSSIVEARNTGAPQIPEFDAELASAQLLRSQGSNFDVPTGEVPVQSMNSPTMGQMDVSTGGPMTTAEVESSVLANASLGRPQPQEDRFPQEDQRIAAQEAELSAIRNRQLSDAERLQMTGIERPPMPNTAEAEEMIAEGLTSPEVSAAAPKAPPIDAPIDAPIIIDTSKLDADIKNNPGDAGSTTSTTLLNTAGVDTSGMDIKRRTVAMRNMLNELMGTTDADEKEEFWMNMAMVGFGIAAGESSDAMKNIADGLLAGTAQITKGNASKKKRNDDITLTAYGEVLADQRAQEKFGRDKILAGMRTSDSGGIYGKRKDPLTQVFLLADTLFDGGAGEFDTYLEAKAAARIQVEKEYNITLPGSGDGGASEMPVITTEAEYDALPVGTKFTQNGETRKKT